MTTITSTVPTKKGVSVFIVRYPLVAIYLIMFIVAWSVMIPQALYSQGILSARLPEFLEILTGWVPRIAAMVAAIALRAVKSGRTAIPAPIEEITCLCSLCVDQNIAAYLQREFAPDIER